MPRPRNPENKGLPARWRHVHGAYYYQVPPGLEAQWDGKKTFRLGSTLPEAYRTWAARIEMDRSDIRTIGQLLDRYAAEVVPEKAAATRTANAAQIAQLRRVFGSTPIHNFKPAWVYRYVDKREAKVNPTHKNTADAPKRKATVAAHREMDLLSHAFTKAVEWGILDSHPFKGEVRLAGEAPRDRYVEDWEILEVLGLPAAKRGRSSIPMIQAYIRIKLMTGMSRGDLLRLQLAQLQDDGIHMQRHKTAGSTGKRTIYEWTPELRQAVELAKSLRPKLSPFLFCNGQGEGYIDEETGKASGWESMWQRFMARVLAETKVKERFTEHDLRAKAGSDAESLEHARALLSHADARTTQAIYRRKAERVKPLKRSHG